MKDVPSDMPPGMILAAMLSRADPHDAFVSLRYDNFNALPQGARVGTSSLRRQCQLKYARPDLQLLTLRGNVETRLRKLQEEQYDAIVLAAAGLIRLGLEERITHRFDLEQFVPAVGQGIIGIECRADDARSIELVRALNDDSRLAMLRGRARIRAQAAGQLSVADRRACADRGRPDLSARRHRFARWTGDLSRRPRRCSRRLQAVGIALADRLLDAGARALLEKLRLSQP